MIRKSKWLVSSLVILVVIVSLLVFWQINAGAQVRDPLACDYAGCGPIKQTAIAQIEQTALAKSRSSQFAPEASIVPTLAKAKYTLEEKDKEIIELPTYIGRQFIKTITSYWKVGTLLSADASVICSYYIWAETGKDGSSTIGTFIFGSNKEIEDKYGGYWTLPENIGDVTITGITGIEGMVFFRGSFGKEGYFDLKTKTFGGLSSPLPKNLPTPTGSVPPTPIPVTKPTPAPKSTPAL